MKRSIFLTYWITNICTSSYFIKWTVIDRGGRNELVDEEGRGGGEPDTGSPNVKCKKW